MITWRHPQRQAGVNPERRSDRQDHILKTRLGTAEDSYWWILAGGIHVPGFDPTIKDPEIYSPNSHTTGTAPMLQPLTQIHSEFRLDVLVDDPQDLGPLLDQAVQRLIPAALERRQGILVTQVLPDKYTVEVHQDVMCGVVQERRSDPNAQASVADQQHDP